MQQGARYQGFHSGFLSPAPFRWLRWAPSPRRQALPLDPMDRNHVSDWDWDGLRRIGEKVHGARRKDGVEHPEYLRPAARRAAELPRRTIKRAPRMAVGPSLSRYETGAFGSSSPSRAHRYECAGSSLSRPMGPIWKRSAPCSSLVASKVRAIPGSARPAFSMSAGAFQPGCDVGWG
jgi:hypothetical protein